MKIDSSTVAMSSKRTYSSFEEKKKVTLTGTSEQIDSLDVSAEGKSLMEQYKEENIRRKEEQDKRARENFQRHLAESSNRSQTVQEAGTSVKSPDEMKLEILKNLLEALRRGKGIDLQKISSDLKSIRNQYQGNFHAEGSDQANTSGTATASPGVTTWKKVTIESGFFSEYESTAYQAAGVVKTTDGRQISFGISVEMSRAFCQKYEKFTKEDYICTDPLVINLDSSTVSVSDQKFLFDLNGDGKEESISFVGKGSGFLALDKNRDGKINDGNELFGTKSGNGFKDLSKYDQDSNGWIDENDDIFNDLVIWTKDDAGNDRLMSLKDAGVGAVYLENAATEFSLKNDENKTDGVIRSTGIYLKENGETGTIQHIDLTS